MAPHAFVNGDGQQKRNSITILVTGFGPFQERYPINPSFEIARSLPSILPSKTADGLDIHIITYGTPIHVSYREVYELVPLLHESFQGTVDLVLHIGMASGRSFYTFELHGHRDGYTRNKDLEGKTLPPDHGLIHFQDCPSMMTTSFDCAGLLKDWKANITDIPETSPAHAADVRPSEDAGHYLCDYIYFNSLAWFDRQSGSLDGTKASNRPVMFLHVPADSDSVTLAKGREVTMALIEAMVSNWCSLDEDERR
ncbi:MAG: hypothetical protein Q9224_007694 [Gallowayella concinna]